MTRKVIIPFAGFGFLILATAGASAAAPDHCALYAREYARLTETASTAEALQRAQDKAFYKCLNMDEDPALPDASAYSDVVGGVDVVGEGDAASGDVIADEPAVPRPKASTGGRGSGLTRWSAEWTAWCAAHYPNSFDPKTGTVLPLDSNQRTMCP